MKADETVQKASSPQLHSKHVGKSHFPIVLAASYKEPWTATVWDNVKLYSLQLAAVGGSGAFAKCAVAPLERVKVLLQVQPMSELPADERYRGLRDAWRRIPQREGLAAFYRGNGANVARLVPEVALKFALNDQFRVMFSPADGQPPGIQAQLAAGAATGVVKTAVCYPLQLAHTRLAADASRWNQPRLYTGLLHCLLQTVRVEGVAGLYKGFLGSVAGVGPYLAVSFTAYESLSQQLPDSKAARSAWWFPLSKVAMGASASVLAQAVSYPIDTVRRRMQLNGAPGQAVTYRSYWHVFKSMAVAEGPRSFYRGLGVNCIKTAPGAAIQFLAYDLIRSGLLAMDPAAAL